MKQLLRNFKPLLYGSKVNVHTDNRNICYDSDPLTSRAQKWKMEIQNFGAQFKHMVGQKFRRRLLIALLVNTAAERVRFTVVSCKTTKREPRLRC